MSGLVINDLPQSRELDSRALSAVRGGFFNPGFLLEGPLVSIDKISQEISVAQDLDINAANGVTVIGGAFAFELGDLGLGVEVGNEVDL